MVAMDPRAVAGLTFIVLIAILLGGTYSALMPTQLGITVHNRSTSMHEVSLVLTKDGGTVQSWKFTVDPGAARSLQYPLDIGSHRLTASMQGSGNATADFEIPFKFLDKAHPEIFTITPAGIFRGNIY